MNSNNYKFHRIPRSDGTVPDCVPSHSKGKTGRNLGLKLVKPAVWKFPFNESDYVLDFPGSGSEFRNRIVEEF